MGNRMNNNYYNGEIGMGGFSLDNIRNWIIEECIKSGDYTCFFWNIQQVVDDLDDMDWTLDLPIMYNEDNDE
jgi:hypothetical protein